MPNGAIHQSLALVSGSPREAGEARPVSSWPFGLMLLGLAAVLIIAAAGTPDFFAVRLHDLGAQTP